MQDHQPIQVIDCRYPFEYCAGRIRDAVNIYKPEALVHHLFSKLEEVKANIDIDIIFHCEFSQMRSPKMLKFLRNIDREIHADIWPKILYSNIYLL